MSVKIFCECGKDITDQIPVYDKKTRTIDWMDRNPPVCGVCADADKQLVPITTPVLRHPAVRKRAGHC